VKKSGPSSSIHGGAVRLRKGAHDILSSNTGTLGNLSNGKRRFDISGLRRKEFPT
jgi:hypothetical protein